MPSNVIQSKFCQCEESSSALPPRYVEYQIVPGQGARVAGGGTAGHGNGRPANPAPRPAVSERAASTNSPATSPNPNFIANFLVSGIIRITVPPITDHTI